MLNAVTVEYLIGMIEIKHILHDMISGALAFLYIGWIISHVRAAQQLMVCAFEKIKDQTGIWHSVISAVGQSLIKTA